MILKKFGLSFLLIISFSTKLPANMFYKEINVIAGYSKQDQWISESMFMKNSIGFEYFKKFSNEYGDILTTDLQLRLTYDFDEDVKNGFGIEIHNAWIDYKLSLGKDLIIGHFAPTFGLEKVTDTHGTLFQTLAMKNIGFKQDWGIAYKSYFENYDYEISAQIGSGMTFREGGYLLSAQIGTSSNQNFQYTLSLLSGKIMESVEMTTYPVPEIKKESTKKRVGVTFQYFFNSFVLKNELSFGTNDNNKIIGIFSEVDYSFPSIQELDLHLQGRSWSENISNPLDEFSLVAGFSYKISNDFSISTAYFSDGNQIFAQLYYFGL